MRQAADRNHLLSETLLETGDEQILRQLLADEDEKRALLLALAPRLAHVAAHHHVHALEHHALLLAFHPEDALVTQEIRTVDLDHAGEKALELLPVERLVRAEYERLHLVVVLVRDARQEFRVELEDRIQVEAADVEDLGERGIAEMDFLDRRARVHFFQ